MKRTPSGQPYLTQKNAYYCGPACLQMLAAAKGLRLTQSRLARLLRTSKSRGTRRRSLVRGAASLGLRPHAHHATAVAELRGWIAAGAHVVVDYLEPEGDIHFAVVDRITAREIIMRDPWHGPSFRLTMGDFLARWRGSHPRAFRRWMMAATALARAKVRCQKKRPA